MIDFWLGSVIQSVFAFKSGNLPLRSLGVFFHVIDVSCYCLNFCLKSYLGHATTQQPRKPLCGPVPLRPKWGASHLCYHQYRTLAVCYVAAYSVLFVAFSRQIPNLQSLRLKLYLDPLRREGREDFPCPQSSYHDLPSHQGRQRCRQNSYRGCYSDR